MKCVNCGNEISETAKFCEHCGAKAEEVIDAQEEQVTNDAQANAAAEEDALPEEPKAAEEVAASEEASEEQAEVMQNETYVEGAVASENVQGSVKSGFGKNKMIMIISIIAAVVVVAAAATCFALFGSGRAISDEKAATLFDEAIAELHELDYDEAEKLLGKIKLKEDSQYKDMLSELEEIVRARPEITDVDTSDYPNVTVEFETADRKADYEKKDIFIAEADSASDLVISSFAERNGKYSFTYSETESVGGIELSRNIVFDRYREIEFAIPFSLISEYVDDVNLTFVTSNVETYPEISLYLKVVDEYGNPIDNLSEKSFVIREYLNVHDYLERDVIYAAKIDGQDALNVSLAIDRSSSISDNDMGKIKNATNTFLSKLQFQSGDKAEIVSFDTNVMQMCLFTNNRDNLMNGVNSMYPYGMTACYDAIVRSIRNASVQSGARCVIVFTDGLDNESVNTVDSVINLAIEKSVPVYTIGVGRSLDEDALRRIARSTGGTYHHIDDISSMSQIYDEIYREQKNMYHVKYISDTSLTQESSRRISLWVSGGGYRGYCDKTYTPVIPVSASNHSSRYEVIKADITWEDANRVCIDRGGHLATITSKEEEDKIIAVAEASGVERLWIGGYTTNNQYGEAVGHWVMGEPFAYQNWYSEDEPSRFDSDNAAEFYLMLWKINGRWSWNDQRNDLINSPFAKTYEGKMGYVIEYED